MTYSRRIVIDLALEYSEPVSDECLNAIAKSVEEDASGEAATSFLLAIKASGLDSDKVLKWDVSSGTKELDDGD